MEKGKRIKVLVIRLSSLGDIVQALESAHQIKGLFGNETQVDWLVRSDSASFLELCPEIHNIWQLHRKDGLKGLLKLASTLNREKYTHIYDAHNNLRSHIFCLLLAPFWKRCFKSIHLVRRPKERLKRILLFRFRVNKFPWPFNGAKSYVAPLEKWGKASEVTPHKLDFSGLSYFSESYPFIKNSVCLAPSASWPLKRWPIEYWKTLIANYPDFTFTILGGPEDDFCHEISSIAPERVKNMAGKLSWAESAKAISLSRLIVSGDTGLLHMADYMGKPALGLIGPSAFGYPSRTSSLVAELDLPCKPCSKDGRTPCTNKVHQKCLIELTPEQVYDKIDKLLDTKRES